MNSRLPLPEPDESILIPFNAVPAGSKTSFLGSVFGLINKQVAAVQPKDQALADASAKLRKAYSAYLDNDLKRALNLLADAEKSLGQHWFDTPPSGWICYARGVIYLMLDQREQASVWFDQARGGLNHPDMDANYLGRSRSAATENARLSYLAALYISAPTRFEELCSEVETAEMHDYHLARLESRGVDDDAKAVLSAALKEMFEQEKSAAQRSDEAAAHRTQSHILSEADANAEFETQTNFRNLLLTWFTRSRLAGLSSFSNRPNPIFEGVDGAVWETVDENQLNAFVNFKNVFGEQTCRVVMKRECDPSTSAPLWKLAEIWQVFDEEEIQFL